MKLQSINRKEVLQYLQWTGSVIPPEIDLLIDDCIAETLEIVQLRYTWRIFSKTQENIVPVLQGTDVHALLADCEQVIFFAVTLGRQLEFAIRQAQVRDLTRAIVLDCCGSAAVEAVCDLVEVEIQNKLGSQAMYLTDRFSPGYGDLPITVQPVFLDVLDAQRRIGLTATDCNILTPRKSVTALLGIADCPQTKRFRGCAYCSMFETCGLRKAGKVCGKK